MQQRQDEDGSRDEANAGLPQSAWIALLVGLTLAVVVFSIYII